MSMLFSVNLDDILYILVQPKLAVNMGRRVLSESIILCSMLLLHYFILVYLHCSGS
jgi:hypothetical protein